MKFFSSLKSPLIFTLLLIFIILGIIGFNKISKFTDEKPALTSDQIDKVKSNLKIISSTTTHSSIPLDQAKGHEKEYDEILKMDELVVRTKYSLMLN
jgi:hypothetical protein